MTAQHFAWIFIALWVFCGWQNRGNFLEAVVLGFLGACVLSIFMFFIIALLFLALGGGK